jgi:hypothetical protein
LAISLKHTLLYGIKSWRYLNLNWFRTNHEIRPVRQRLLWWPKWYEARRSAIHNTDSTSPSIFPFAVVRDKWLLYHRLFSRWRYLCVFHGHIPKSCSVIGSGYTFGHRKAISHCLV